MASVGYATLQIIPSTRGIKSGLEREFGGIGGAAGSSFSGGFLTNFTRQTIGSLDRLGGQIVDKLGTVMKVGAVGVGAVAGASLWGGLQRALDREDAVVSFRRMGLDQRNIDELTDAIDQALRGTTVTNPQGFGLATRFLATGMALEEIPRRIATIADMAQVGNRSFEEMADVMARAEGQGRITAAELNRMGDIPFARIAEEMGMTESEMRKLASEGGLTADAFAEAFASVDAFNGAAKDATTRQAFANLRTALASLGEQFLGPLLGEGGVAQRALQSMRESVGDLGPAVGRAGQAFADWLIPTAQNLGRIFTESVLPALRTAWEFLDRNRDEIGKLAAAIGPAIAIVAGFATGVNLVGSAFRLLTLASPIGMLTALVAAFIYAWQNSETFRDTVIGAVEAVKNFVVPIIETVIGWVRSFGTENESTANWLSTTWDRISGIFGSALELIRALIDTAVKVITEMWQRFGTHLMNHIEQAWNAIRQIIDGALRVIQGILDVFIAIFTGDWSRAWEGIKGIVSGAWEAIGGIVKLAFEALSAAIGLGMAGISAAWSLVWNGMSTAVGTIWNGITRTVRNAVNGVIGIINGITGGINVVLRFVGLDHLQIGEIPRVGDPTAGGIHARSGGMQEYHTGGIVGRDGTPTDRKVRKNEMLAKLLVGEEVLTEDDPRHIMNLGAVDTDEVLPIGGWLSDRWDNIKSIAGTVAGPFIRGLRQVIAATARPLVNAALATVDAVTGPFGRFGSMFAGLARSVGEGALDWIAGVDRDAEDLMPAEIGRGYQSIIDFMKGTGVPYVVTSTMRPGDPGAHGSGRAVDFSIGGHGNRGYGSPGLRAIFDALAPAIDSLSQLILSGAPSMGGKNPRGAWRQPGQPGNHWNHVHAATFDNGGTLRPGWNSVLNATGADEHLRPAHEFDPDAMGRAVADVAERILRQRMRAAA